MNAFLEGVASSLVASWIDRSLSWVVAQGWFGRRRMHLRELREKLKDMPFIYRDMKLEIGTDFVELETGSLDRSTLMPTPVRRFDRRTTFEKLRDARRVVLIGQAGMGKTTLFRYAIQSFLSRDFAAHVHGAEKVMPFFVPLIAINNASCSPIVRYLLEKSEYLKGPGGLQRLCRLAERRELMLLLDGYDEMPYAGGARYVQNELTALFSSPENVFQSETLDKEFAPFYQRVGRCRIWLSSRREFFASYPFQTGHDVQLLSVLEMGAQRIQLVDRIFARYLSAGREFFVDKLNTEVFMQQLSASADPGLQSLSTNPLFLTVMCYVYVGQLRENLDPEDAWRHGTHELIRRCLELLLRDIDEYKTQGATAIERKARLARRSKYMKEKQRFLPYVAARSYFDGASLLTRNYLTAAARDFFQGPGVTPDAGEILRGLDSRDPAANMVEQLIMSNVFVFKERSATSEGLDFPHRRFRESLAVEHLNDEEGCRKLCERIEDPGFLELLLEYAERTPYGPAVLKAALRRFGKARDRFHVSRLLEECLARLAVADSKRPYVLHEALEQADEAAQVPEWMIAKLTCDDGALERLLQMSSRALDSGDSRLLSMCRRPLAHSARTRLRAVLERACARPRPRDSFAWTLAAMIADEEPELLPNVLGSLWPDKRLDESHSMDFGCLCFAVLHRRPAKVASLAICSIQNAFGAEALSAIKHWAGIHDPKLAMHESLADATARGLSGAGAGYVQPAVIDVWVCDPQAQSATGAQPHPVGSHEWRTTILNASHDINTIRLDLGLSIEDRSETMQDLLRALEEEILSTGASGGRLGPFYVARRDSPAPTQPRSTVELSLNRLMAKSPHLHHLRDLAALSVGFRLTPRGAGSPLYLRTTRRSEYSFAPEQAILVYDPETRLFSIRIDSLRPSYAYTGRIRLADAAGGGCTFRLAPWTQGCFQLQSVALVLPAADVVMDLDQLQIDATLRPADRELFAFAAFPRSPLRLASLITRRNGA